MLLYEIKHSCNIYVSDLETNVGLSLKPVFQLGYFWTQVFISILAFEIRCRGNKILLKIKHLILWLNPYYIT